MTSVNLTQVEALYIAQKILISGVKLCNFIILQQELKTTYHILIRSLQNMNSLANNQDYLKNRIPKTFERWLRNIWDDKVLIVNPTKLRL